MNELQVNIRCPYCKQSLMYDGQIIDGYPSIKVVIQNSNKRGMLYLSSIYGSYNIISEFNKLSSYFLRDGSANTS